MRHGRKSRSVRFDGYKRHALTGLVTAAGITPANTPEASVTGGITADQLTCPAGVNIGFRPGKTVHFPKNTCAACPLRQRCTTSSNGRSVSIHPDEALLAELRQRQQTPAGRAQLRERVQVEHTLAHVGHWQGRRARYRGTRKTCSTCAASPWSTNLHVIARQPAADELAA
jgi:Transposase DDE domain